MQEIDRWVETGIDGAVQALLSYEFIVAACVIIASYMVYGWVQIVRKARPLKTKLTTLTSKLRGMDGPRAFTEAFEEYNEEANATIGLPWREFVDTLVIPDTDDGNGIIQNTADGSKYLNDNTIIFPELSLKTYQAVPNRLTGMGILATFLGLAAGVHAASLGLTSDDPGEITSALQNLLSGAGLAFTTSIVGIGCSLAFSTWETWYTRKLHVALDEWIGAIEHHVKRITPESIAIGQLKAARETADSVTAFNDQLAFKLDEALSKNVTNQLVPELRNLAEKIDALRTDRATDAKSVIDETLQQLVKEIRGRSQAEMDGLANTIGALNETLAESLSRSQQRDAEIDGMMTNVVRTIEETLKASTQQMSAGMRTVLDDIAQRLQGIGERETQRMTEATDHNNAALRSTTAQLGDTADALRQGAADNQEILEGTRKVIETTTGILEQTAEIRAEMETTIRELRKGAAQVNENHAGAAKSAEALLQATTNLDGLLTNVSSAVEAAESVGPLVNQLRSSTETLDLSTTASREILGRVSQTANEVESLKALIKKTHEQLATSVEPMRDASRRMADAAETNRRNADRNAEAAQTVAESVTVLKTQQEETREVWANYQGRFENVDRSLERVFQQIDENLAGHREHVKEFLENTDTYVSRIAGSLADAAGELKTIVEDLVEHQETQGTPRRPSGHVQ